MPTTTPTPNSRQEFVGAAREVRLMLDNLRSSVLARDTNLILGYYDKNARIFDGRDTLQHRDLESFRSFWEECFASSPDFSYDIHDVHIETSGNLCVCTMFLHARGTDTHGGSIESWLRVTNCVRRIDGAWKIIHEHVSVPGDFYTGKVLENLKPGEIVNEERRQKH